MTARSAKPQDYREYVRMDVGMPLNPKIASLGDDAPFGGWLAFTAVCYCARNLTDGHFVPGVVYRMAGVAPEIGEALAEIGMWHKPGHECPDCPQPDARMFVVHDYLEHQRSRGEVESLREKKSAAGAKGAAKRWEGKQAAKSSKPAPAASVVAPATAPVVAPATAPVMAPAMAPVMAPAMAPVMAPVMAGDVANGMADAWQSPWQTDGRAMAEVEVEVEVEEVQNPTLFLAPGGATEKPSIQHQVGTGAGYTDAQVLVGAYCDAVTADGGVHTDSMRQAIGRNIKRLIQKDNIDLPILLVAVQRAGIQRSRTVDPFLGEARQKYDRTTQSRRALSDAWEERASRLKTAMATQPAHQIGA